MCVQTDQGCKAKCDPFKSLPNSSSSQFAHMAEFNNPLADVQFSVECVHTLAVCASKPALARLPLANTPNRMNCVHMGSCIADVLALARVQIVPTLEISVLSENLAQWQGVTTLAAALNGWETQCGRLSCLQGMKARPVMHWVNYVQDGQLNVP